MARPPPPVLRPQIVQDLLVIGLLAAADDLAQLVADVGLQVAVRDEGGAGGDLGILEAYQPAQLQEILRAAPVAVAELLAIRHVVDGHLVAGKITADLDARGIDRHHHRAVETAAPCQLR